MYQFKLEISQMLKEHPILQEKEFYKRGYINVLEYFVRKYSPYDKWANAALLLYKKAILKQPQDYTYDGSARHGHPDNVPLDKFIFFPYRYCLVIDCVFMNAINDKPKGERLYLEMSGIFNKRYHKKIRQVFDALFDSDWSFLSLSEYRRIKFLVDCWNINSDFLKKKPVKIMITATMSAGKSTLLNAVVGKKINLTKNDSCTAKIHYIKNKPYEDGYCYELDHDLELDADKQTLMDDNVLNSGNEITVGTHFRTVGRPSERIWLIDTPGVNSYLNKEHKDVTLRYIKETDVDMLIYLLNGENIGSDDDRTHLRFILENYKGKTVFVVNKLDKFKKKEDSVSETLSAVEDDLKKLGFSEPLVVPISSYAAYLAKMSIFKEALDEDEREELSRMARKLQKDEYRFDTYYPDSPGESITTDNSAENYQLLLHCGILQLEKIIYGNRG